MNRNFANKILKLVSSIKIVARLYSVVLLAAICVASCRDKPDEKAPEFTDSTATGKTGAGAGDSSTIKKSTGASGDSIGYIPGTKKMKDSAKKTTVLKTGSNRKDSVQQDPKTRDAKQASTATVENVPATKANNDKPAPGAKPATSVAAPEVFVSKYGVIPRNATEDNIIEFLKAFQDKTILIKINFDGTAIDAEMKGVKAQITKVLKNTGYTNISDQSMITEPIRMPKEIHFELQHDGSVVIWVPVAPNS
jgi:hypothetical protein